ncbi:proline--tRNA ligase [Candidatus Micrarchaeota archaeon]|nr:proline--tRNA ligase [Candidatus Micrarchaeota archaeon]
MKNPKSNFSEWYTEVIQDAELADIRYNVKGFLAHMPWSVRTMKKMYLILEDELERKGHEPAWFPALVPESYFKKEAEHAKGFSADVFWVTEGGSENSKFPERLAMRPTSETAMYTMYSLWIRTWRDLPFKMYQSCQVWRFEGKSTRPFIRGREFYWTEAHDVFETQKEAEKQVEEDMDTTGKLLKELAIPFIFFKRPEHDKFCGAVSTYAADSIMPDGKLIQLPSTHFLGQNFSKAFNIKFVDKDGKEQYGWQTCYGPAVWRIFGAMVAIHGDDKGLVMPPSVAPLMAVIIPIYFKGSDEKIAEKAKSVKKLLEGAGISSKVDDKPEHTPGWKYNYWELKGVPVRIEIGPKDIEKKQLVLVRRDTGEKITVKEGELVEKVRELLEKIQKNLWERAEKFFREHISEAKDMEQLKKTLNERGGLVKVEWCGSVECADYIKAETVGGDMRGTPLGKEEKPKGKCIRCGKKAEQVVYVGKAY